MCVSEIVLRAQHGTLDWTEQKSMMNWGDSRVNPYYFCFFFCLYWPFIYDTVRTLTVQRIACEISSHHIKYGWIVVAGARWWSVWCRDSGVCAFNHIHVMMNLMRKRSGQMQYLHKYASSDVPISYEDETI